MKCKELLTNAFEKSGIIFNCKNCFCSEQCEKLNACLACYQMVREYKFILAETIGNEGLEEVYKEIADQTDSLIAAA